MGSEQISTVITDLLAKAIETNPSIELIDCLIDRLNDAAYTQKKCEFIAALQKFQWEIPIIVKEKIASFDTRSGGKMSYKYAPLDSIIAQIKPALKASGLCYRFEYLTDAGSSKLGVTCHLYHLSGHTELTTMWGDPDTSGLKNTNQSHASTITYLERYTLKGALGISTADEDLDGKTEQTRSKSATINGMLERMGAPDQLDSMLAVIDATDDLDALTDLGKRISLIKDKAILPQLRAAYASKLKLLKGKMNELRQNNAGGQPGQTIRSESD